MRGLFVSLLLACLSACGSAQSSSGVQVEIVPAADGARCYALVQDGVVRGGNCVR